MNYWLWILPLIAAFLGWLANKTLITLLFHPKKPVRLLGITWQGIIPQKKLKIAQHLGKVIKEDLFSIEEITVAITNPTNLEKLTPLVEVHIDRFLNEKLSTEMPMLSMFISEKTIGKLKAVFMGELNEMFPALMFQYAGNLKQQLDLEKIVTQKVTDYPNDKLEKMLMDSLQSERRFIEMMGGVVGFFIGLLLLAITALIS